MRLGPAGRLGSLVARGAVGVVLLGALILPPAPATAAEEQLVAIHVGTVLTHAGAGGQDPALGPLNAQLRRMFRYPGYRLVRRQVRSTPLGREARFRLPGNRTLVVVPARLQGSEHVVLELMLDEGGRRLIDSKVAVAGDARVLLGGPPHAGGVLIIAVGARPVSAEPLPGLDSATPDARGER